jgi:predicted metal-dependent hydrolase
MKAMSPFGPFAVPCAREGAPEGYLCFWALWSEGCYFESHEVLEVLWRATPGPERWFYQGLIHCAAALYHQRCGNAVGAARQCERAEARLSPFTPVFGGIRVDALIEYVQQETASSLAGLGGAQRCSLRKLRERLRQITMRHFPTGKYEGKWEDLYGR